MNEFEIIQYPQINGLNLFFDTITYRTPHIHPELEVDWIVSGTLIVNSGRDTFEVPTGSLLVMSPGQTHEFSTAERSCTILCMQLQPKALLNMVPELEQLDFGVNHTDEVLTPEAKEELHAMLLRLSRCYFERKPFYELDCLGETCRILSLLSRTLPVRVVSNSEAAELERRNARLMRLIRFVDENYMHKILLTDFAEQEDRSVSYLSHFIRDMLSQTFQEYVNTVRFNAACKEMASGNRSMMEICMRCGFSDYRYFSRTFRERTGLTPEEFSKIAAEEYSEQIHVHRSLHSLERFYSRERCMELLGMLEATGTVTL